MKKYGLILFLTYLLSGCNPADPTKYNLKPVINDENNIQQILSYYKENIVTSKYQEQVNQLQEQVKEIKEDKNATEEQKEQQLIDLAHQYHALYQHISQDNITGFHQLLMDMTTVNLSKLPIDIQQEYITCGEKIDSFVQQKNYKQAQSCLKKVKEINEEYQLGLINELLE